MSHRRIRRSIAAVGVLAASLLLSPRLTRAEGEIYWFTLLSENVYVAMDFYVEMFDWQIDSSPTGGLLALRDGRPLAGLNEIADRMPEASESLWLAAITVADPAASVAAARRLGATIHEDVTELPGWGSYALIQDPQGAPVLLVAPTRPLGGNSGFGGWRWAELWTHDPAAAAEFYREVIGYELESVPVGEGTYDVFRASDQRRAGLVRLERPEVAARWAPYIGVPDLRVALVRVWQAGGEVLREPAEIDFEAAGADRVGMIKDPSGAVLFLYQLEEQATSDPIVAARARTGGSRPAQPRAAADDGPEVYLSVSVGYGFGPGWGSVAPVYPARPFRPF